jgi:hypothetical protein
MKKKKQSRESELYSFEGSYPNIAAWVSNGGWVEIGYVEYTGSFVRALEEGGIIWEGVSRSESGKAPIGISRQPFRGLA